MHSNSMSLCSHSEVLCSAGDEEGPFWQRPWRLRAAVLYGWRAHRQRLTAIAAHPNELLVATAGRGHVGGQDQEVVRCWNLADAAAGDPYPSMSSSCSSCPHGPTCPGNPPSPEKQTDCVATAGCLLARVLLQGHNTLRNA